MRCLIGIVVVLLIMPTVSADLLYDGSERIELIGPPDLHAKIVLTKQQKIAERMETLEPFVDAFALAPF